MPTKSVSNRLKHNQLKRTNKNVSAALETVTFLRISATHLLHENSRPNNTIQSSKICRNPAIILKRELMANFKRENQKKEFHREKSGNNTIVRVFFI